MAAEFLLVLLLAIAGPASYAVEHIVGGCAGWAPAVDYAKWAAGETFFIGDTFRFIYGDTHGVNQVTLESYNDCRTDNSIKAYTGCNTIITLTERGPMYFICPTPGHCAEDGMKLSIIVFAGTATPTTTPTIANTTPPDALGGGMIYDSPSDSKPNVTIYVTPFSAANSFGEAVNYYFIIGVSMVLATVLGFMG